MGNCCVVILFSRSKLVVVKGERRGRVIYCIPAVRPWRPRCLFGQSGRRITLFRVMATEFFDVLHHDIQIVGNSDKLKVVRADKPLLEQLDFYPVDQSATEFGAYQYNGRGRPFAGLNQRQALEELVQRTKDTRQSDKGGDMHKK